MFIAILQQRVFLWLLPSLLLLAVAVVVIVVVAVVVVVAIFVVVVAVVVVAVAVLKNCVTTNLTMASIVKVAAVATESTCCCSPQL